MLGVVTVWTLLCSNGLLGKKDACRDVGSNLLKLRSPALHVAVVPGGCHETWHRWVPQLSYAILRAAAIMLDESKTDLGKCVIDYDHELSAGLVDSCRALEGEKCLQ